MRNEKIQHAHTNTEFQILKKRTIRPVGMTSREKYAKRESVTRFRREKCRTGRCMFGLNFPLFFAGFSFFITVMRDATSTELRVCKFVFFFYCDFSFVCVFLFRA